MSVSLFRSSCLVYISLSLSLSFFILSTSLLLNLQNLILKVDLVFLFVRFTRFVSSFCLSHCLSVTLYLTIPLCLNPFLSVCPSYSLFVSPFLYFLSVCLLIGCESCVSLVLLWLFVANIFSQKHLLKLFQSSEALSIVELDSGYGRALERHDFGVVDDDVGGHDDIGVALLLTHLISS